MSRGQDLAEGLRIVHDLSELSSVRTVIEFRGDTVVFERTQDMEPILEHVRAMRERNEDRSRSGWGEGREVGHIPEIFYAKIRIIPDFNERKRAVREFFQKHPVFCAYAPYLRTWGR